MSDDESVPSVRRSKGKKPQAKKYEDEVPLTLSNPLALAMESEQEYRDWLAGSVPLSTRVEFVNSLCGEWPEDQEKVRYLECGAWRRAIQRFETEVLRTRLQLDPSLWSHAQGSRLVDCYYPQETDRLRNQLRTRGPGGLEGLVEELRPGQGLLAYSTLTLEELRRGTAIEATFRDLGRNVEDQRRMLAHAPKFDTSSSFVTRCRHCHSDRVSSFQRQTASGDEAMATWIQCHNPICGKKYRSRLA